MPKSKQEPLEPWVNLAPNSLKAGAAAKYKALRDLFALVAEAKDEFAEAMNADLPALADNTERRYSFRRGNIGFAVFSTAKGSKGTVSLQDYLKTHAA